jgi:hypothetical protein
MYILGNKYVEIKTTLLQKNVKAGLKEKEFSDIKSGRIYQLVNNQDICPYEAFEKYYQFIDGCNSFFPKVLKNGKFSKTLNIGHNTLGKFMHDLSSTLHLSKVYTNHCIRVTLVNILRCIGYSRKEVCLITGHKNEESLGVYERTDDDVLLKNMSKSLSEYMPRIDVPHEDNDNYTVINREEDSHIQPFSSTIISAPLQKKMKMTCSGETNTVIIEFI